MTKIPIVLLSFVLAIHCLKLEYVPFSKVEIDSMAGGTKPGELYASPDATIKDLMSKMNADAIWVGKKIYDDDDEDVRIDDLDFSKTLKIVQADHLGAEHKGNADNVFVLWDSGKYEVNN